jgi:N-acetylmuramoyl-L-alanine amidase CwlA
MLKTLTIKKKLTPYNFTDVNNKNRAKFIVIHYFGSLGTAEAVANYFANAYRGASAHLNLDEGKTVWQSVELDDTAWHCGTTGTYLHKTCRNSNSIGIEVRPYILDSSQSSSAAYKGWYFGTQVVENLVELTRHLMEEYNIPIENVIRHYDVTGKWCPRPWMGTDKNLYYQTTGDAQWALFKARLAGKEDEMAKIIEQIASAAGLSEEKTIQALGVLVKFANISEEKWEQEGAQYLIDEGIITTPRDGREMVEFGELGVIFKNLGLTTKKTKSKD